MNRPLKTALDVTVAGLKTVADAGLLPPGFAVVTSIVNAIVETCHQVKVHQGECKMIADKAIRLHNLLEDQTKRLAETPLIDSVSEVQGTLISVRDKLNKFASWSFFRCFRNDALIADDLRKSMEALDFTMYSFNVNGISILTAGVTGPDGLQKHIRILLSQMDQLTRQQTVMLKLIVARTGVQELGMAPEVLQRFQGEATEELKSMQSQLSDPSLKQIYIGDKPVNRIVANNVYLEMMEGAGAIHEWLRAGPVVRDLNGLVKKHGDIPFSGGTITDVFQGKYLAKYTVAVKSIRNAQVVDKSLEKRVRHELNVWRHLKHEYILNLLGICTDLGAYICLISLWQENGNLLERNPNADRLRLLIGAAKGIDYLHGVPIVHGNLKCSKILVGEGEKALVSDFQMAKVLNSAVSSGLSVTIQASARWSAPEYSDSMAAHPPADVFSFAMVMLECLTLERPFNNMRREVEVNTYVLRGGRPSRPKRNPWVTDRVWELMKDCWQESWEKRPTMKEVIRRLEAIEKARMEM